MTKTTVMHRETLNALSRVEGQVRGVKRMIEQEEYCIDILTQLHAVRAALDKVGRQILRKHIEHCVVQAIQGGDARDRHEKIEQIINILKLKGV